MRSIWRHCLPVAVLVTGCSTNMRAPVVELWSTASPELRAALPPGACRSFTIENFRPPGIQADTVILSGHGLPPQFLGRPAPAVAAAIASFKPSLIVLDTCYSAATPLLSALAAQGLRSWVVAAPFLLPETGMVFAPDFANHSDAEARARLVRTEPPFPLLRWQLDPDALKQVQASIDTMTPAQLEQRLLRRHPALVRVPLRSGLAAAGMVLVPVPAARFRLPRAPNRSEHAQLP